MGTIKSVEDTDPELAFRGPVWHTFKVGMVIGMFATLAWGTAIWWFIR
jgi:5-methylthioribose kinase